MDHDQAMERARTRPAEHEPRHVSRGEIHRRVHGTSPIAQFNDRLAVIVTQNIGSMWAAYVFVLISLVSFPQALSAFLSGDRVTGISWLSQSFLQLVLLPVIMVGQRVISTAQDARAEADHETLTALQRINVQQLQILQILQRLSEKDQAS